MIRRRLEEPIHVTLTAGGTPERLVWGKTRWVAIDRPVLWVDRDRWWETETTQAPRNPTAGFPVWRTQIAPLGNEDAEAARLVDIAYRENRWIILNIFDPERSGGDGALEL